MFSTMDSQPQEWLLNDTNALHTLCVCRFRDSAHARKWIYALVPRNQHGKLLKWSSGSRKERTEQRRSKFIDAMEQYYNDIDFRIHCISSTEGQISKRSICRISKTSVRLLMQRARIALYFE
jgi:hypothetical protein